MLRHPVEHFYHAWHSEAFATARAKVSMAVFLKDPLGNMASLSDSQHTTLVNGQAYAERAVQFHPHGGQPEFVWLSARTPHGGASYAW